MNARSQNRTPVPFTPWQELRRYGLYRAFVSYWTCGSLLVSLLLAFTLPWFDPSIFDALAAVHATMLGVGITVFGFTILGGKDDFFEPLMLAQGKKGLNALHDMVLLLFWPLILHAAALLLCLVRMSEPLFELETVKYSWRVGYGFVALWSAVQSYQSLRYLFVLANVHLAWRYKVMSAKGQPQVAGQTAPQAAPLADSTFETPEGAAPPPAAEPPKQAE